MLLPERPAGGSLAHRVLAALLACSTFASALHADEPVVLYDLRYTLKFDPGDPAQVKMAWDHAHAVATLQGIVNRVGPTLYLRFVDSHTVGGKNIDDYWLDKLREPGQWLHGRRIETVSGIVALVEKYRHAVNGAVVYDPNVPATSNLASTIAGVENLIAVRYDPSPDSLYGQLIEKGPKLPVRVWLLEPNGASLFTGTGKIPGTERASTGSAKCDAYLWMKHNYLDTGRCDGSYGAFFIDSYWMRNPRATVPNHHTLTNHDFFVGKKAFFFDLNVWTDETPVDDRGQKPGTDRATLMELLHSAYRHGGRERMIHLGGFTPWAYKYTTHGSAGGKHDGVPTEWEYGRIASAYNGYMDPGAIGFGAIANASFFTHFPLEKSYPQKWVTHEDLRKRGYLTPEGRVRFDGRDFIVFYVGDYDAAAWVYQRVIDIWDDENRGKVPLMWCISPMLERRIPMALDYMRRTATPNDYFAAADNGAGYLNPGMLQEPRPISGLPSGLDAWARHCEPIYKRWGLTITGFVIDGYAPGLNEAGLDCYARFSPNGIVPQKIPLSLLHGAMPVIRADHDINQTPARAVEIIRERVRKRPLPFHWFRNILKKPTWYVDVVAGLKQADPKIELLDAPTFFELYRIYLKNHTGPAQGRVPRQ